MKNNTNGAREWGLIVDYAMWYFIQVVMILFAFLVVYNKTPIAGDLQAYKVHFDEIMHEPVFITIFVGIVQLGNEVFKVLDIKDFRIQRGQDIFQKNIHPRFSEIDERKI